MKRAIQLNALLGWIVFVWSILLVLNGTFGWEFLRPVSMVAFVLGLGVAAFDRYLWRLPFLHPWPIRTPDVRGTWRGRYKSNFQRGDGQQAEGEAFLVVRQTFSSVRVVMMTEESRSATIACSVTTREDEGYQLVGVFRNTPKSLLREGSPIHVGGIILSIVGETKRPTLDGEYFTDRETKGQLTFRKRNRKAVHDDLERARKQKYASVGD